LIRAPFFASISLMIIDTHSHLNFNAYKKDLKEVLKRTIDNNIWIINVGSKYETSKKAVEIANMSKKGVYATIGLHPIHSTSGIMKIKTDKEEGGFETKGEEFNKKKYRELSKSDKVVAIGEIGLDYYYKPKTTKKKELFKEKQKKVFREQLDLAKELSLPVILHCRMAHKDVVYIIKDYNLKGVIHCFTGTVQEMKQYLNIGFYIGFNGIIFKMNLDKAIEECPLDRILIETDCPYLTPEKEGNKRNEPLFIKHVIEKIAKIKKVSSKEIEEKTFENASSLFGI